VRWDRIGRVAMLVVLCALVYLYISPARSLLAAVHESAQRRDAVIQLEHENARLLAQQKALQSPDTLEEAARNLGLVLPGERPYVVSGLPSD